MNAQILEITASYTPEPIQDFRNMSSSSVMNICLNRGYENFILQGGFVEKICNGAFLFVENDIQFLVEGYLHLEELVQAQNNYQHGAYLNDGRFSFASRSGQGDVEINMKYCPDLNVANLVARSVTVSNDEYLWWWRNVARQIINIIS